MALRLHSQRALLVVAGLGLALAGQARAGDTEARTYQVQVDSKPAGEYRMVIHRQDDGYVSMASESQVQVKVLLVTAYSYAYKGVEVWKDGRLVHFESSGKENSKAFAISADSEGNGLRVRANGKEELIRPDVWTTSVWQLPSTKQPSQTVSLLGCDTGVVSAAPLQLVGSERMKVSGQEQSCTHYRLQRDTTRELWYDSQNRLIRQEWTSNGHHTVLELKTVAH